MASNADQQMDLKTKIYFAKFKKDVKREIFKTDLCDFTKKKSWISTHFRLKLVLRYFNEKTENEQKKLVNWQSEMFWMPKVA